MGHHIDQASLDTLFVKARSLRKWLNKPVSEATLREIFELLILGPTSGNCCPARFIFVTSDECKQRILPHLVESNVASTMTAPVTVIVATDTEFWREMAPSSKFARSFAEMGAPAQEHAFRNGTLQGAYLIMAARAVGLDCGAMSGFNQAGLDAEFFPDGRLKSNFLCNLGYGDYSEIAARPERPPFERMCQLA